MTIKPWNIHNCARDSECRAIDPNPPNRLHLNTPYGSLVIALDGDGWTQGWLPFKGYVDSWWPLAWHPRHKAYHPRNETTPMNDFHAWATRMSASHRWFELLYVLIFFVLGMGALALLAQLFT